MTSNQSPSPKARWQKTIRTTCKILLCLLPVLLFGSWLYAMFGGRCTYPLSQPADSITHIYLVEFQKEIGLYSYSADEISDILSHTHTVVAELSPAEIAPFLEDFKSIPCYKWGNDPNPYIKAGTILIQYADSSREWLSSCGTFIDSTDPKERTLTWYYFDPESFDALLTSYGYLP